MNSFSFKCLVLVCLVWDSVGAVAVNLSDYVLIHEVVDHDISSQAFCEEDYLF